MWQSAGMASFDITCPLPLGPSDRVLMAHGGGGRRSQEIIRDLFGAAFDDPALKLYADATVVDGGARIAMTTDSYVVSPLRFTGADIGKLAVYGTVNDLAMVGARPAYLSVAFVLEEGLPLRDLWETVLSMREAARRAEVRIITGDTKVVERGRAEGLYINTTGVGIVQDGGFSGAAALEDGAAVLLSGDIGRHGVAVMAARGSLGFAADIASDCAPLHEVALDLVAQIPGVYAMRDLTRGGLSSALVELAESSGVEIEIDEAAVPVTDAVRGACEMLGLDPTYVANEGRFVACVPASQADAALAVMRAHDVARGAVLIGHVRAAERARVVARTALGSRRLVEMFSGEQLPRIC